MTPDSATEGILTLLHQRGSALADLLKRRFEATKFFRAQFSKRFPHLPRMISEG
jgi:hypothetical protein